MDKSNLCIGFHAPNFKEGDCETRDCHLDEGIAEIVYGLFEKGVDTFGSCDGNHDNAINLRRVLFGRNDSLAGVVALRYAVELDMPVYLLQKCYPASSIKENKFYWELIFDRHQDWDRVKGRLARR